MGKGREGMRKDEKGKGKRKKEKNASWNLKEVEGSRGLGVADV